MLGFFALVIMCWRTLLQVDILPKQVHNRGVCRQEKHRSASRCSKVRSIC